MSEKIEYPKWLYHKTLDAKVVQSQEEQKALGKEWEESPFEAEAEAALPVEKVSEILEETEAEVKTVTKKAKGHK